MCQKAFQKNLDVAHAYYKLSEYANALEYYQRSYNLKKDLLVAQQIANCSYKVQRYKDAVNWYQLICSKDNLPSDIYYKYAQALMSVGLFSDARQQVMFIRQRQKPLTEEQRQFIINVDSAEKWTSNPLKNIEVINLKRINSPYSEINPMFYNSGLTFSSSRESIIIKTRNGQSNAPYYNLFKTDTSKNQTWRKPAPFSTSLNTYDHEGAIAFSKDEKTIYITRGTHKEYTKSMDNGINSLKLYKSTKKSLTWSNPEPFMLNDSLSSFGHPSIGFNDNVFIFASNMEGGYGGTDLYITFKLDSGWKVPINMGPNVNTKGNELYPYLLDNGTLYFSSNKHIGLGGYDVFKTKLEAGEWTKPVNLKAPINTSYDDFSLIIDEGMKQGFFSSNRPKGLGEEDIYQFIIH